MIVTTEDRIFKSLALLSALTVFFCKKSGCAILDYYSACVGNAGLRNQEIHQA